MHQNVRAREIYTPNIPRRIKRSNSFGLVGKWMVQIRKMFIFLFLTIKYKKIKVPKSVLFGFKLRLGLAAGKALCVCVCVCMVHCNVSFRVYSHPMLGVPGIGLDLTRH